MSPPQDVALSSKRCTESYNLVEMANVQATVVLLKGLSKTSCVPGVSFSLVAGPVLYSASSIDTWSREKTTADLLIDTTVSPPEKPLLT